MQNTLLSDKTIIVLLNYYSGPGPGQNPMEDHRQPQPRAKKKKISGSFLLHLAEINVHQYQFDTSAAFQLDLSEELFKGPRFFTKNEPHHPCDEDSRKNTQF